MATNPHIYVSSVVGTNTGASDTSFASQQTGNITSLTASDVYDNLQSAIAGASPSAGDTIYLCDNHNAAYAAGSDVVLDTGSSDGTGLPIRCISVDNTAIDEYLAGASEELTDGVDFTFEGKFLLAGIDFKAGDDTISLLTMTSVQIQDCTIYSSDGGDDQAVRLNFDGAIATLINTTINIGGTGVVPLRLIGGSRIYWKGGSYAGSSATLVGGFGANGGFTLDIEGVDLSSFASSLCQTVTSGADVILYRFQNCQLNSSVTLPTAGTTLTAYRHRFEMYNCDDSTGNSLHRFYIVSGCGEAKNNDSIYVTANQPFFEGSDKSCIQVKTTSEASHSTPFTFELPARYIEMAAGVSDTVSINLLTEGTLNDNDIAFFLCYPDGTTQVQPNWISSATGSASYALDPLATGSELNTTGALTASDWTGEDTLTSPKYYKVNLDTSVDAGSASAPILRVEVYKEIDGTTGNKLYIDPILTVGT